MLSRIQFDKVLFLDIETVPQIYQYQDLDEKGQELFYAKNRFQVNPEKNIETIYNEKGGFRQFGLGYKQKTVIPIWVVSIVLAIACYLFLYYLEKYGN